MVFAGSATISNVTDKQKAQRKTNFLSMIVLSKTAELAA